MCELLTHARVAACLGARRRDSNKGDNGKGLLLAGSEGLFGAALMSAAACLRGGIGTLKALCPTGARAYFAALPEAMLLDVGATWTACDRAMVRAHVKEADCIALGPGMGREEAVQAILLATLEAGKPTVIDADGLNALSAMAGERPPLHPNVILTPHPREMHRLCGAPVMEIAADLPGYAARYARAWGCTVLLKGAQSAIAAPDGRICRNATGNAGLAKGGSGDVLTGIILALLGQGLSAFDAACAGSYLLGASAEEALALLNERALLARDVIDAIARTLQSF
ncbi:MAG: NAD(P)H-hydrate dehydratase [Christensenellaceae bacterium]|jgi:NAD(P)H-hydrate epimerase|nr:NAD(P)H-hydrate dehydratase [Christensenellaceae bacterium]